MNTFITELMSRMPLEEKLGQLNQQPAGDITTGTPQNTDAGRLAAQGRLGSIFNIMDVQEIH